MSARPLLRRIRRFGRLSSESRRLAVEAALALLLAQLLVRFIPPRFWLRLLDVEPGARPGGDIGPTSVQPRQQDLRVPRKVGRIAGKMARHLPFRARCLAQSMAAQWMLRRRGIRSILAFGVRRSVGENASLEYHAWLMVGGECVIGGSEIGSYSPFPPFAAPGSGP